MGKRILRLIGLLQMILLLGVMSTVVLAEEWPIRVVVNEADVLFPDGKPYMDSNNRILVPVRFVSEELGAEVKWDAAKQRVTV